MKKQFTILLTAFASMLTAQAAFVFRTGTFYFDNSLPSFARPQIVIGNSSESIVIDMDFNKELGFWEFDLPTEIAATEGYFFTEAYLEQGDAASLQEVVATLDDAEVSHTDIESKYATPSRVFYPFPFTTYNPEGFSNSGYWRRLDSFDLTPSGSLPVLYINTEDSQPVTAKQPYLAATYYLDPMGHDDIEPIGSAAKPLDLQIKGRGNATWNKYYKKPYRVKFDKKAAILGMKKSKHFVLLPHADMFQPYVFDEVGFEVARHLNMPWTPSQRPVELMLNDEYQGIYWVCEKIRVDEDRVNIVEQKDNETDLELITGGWLMEIDNIPSEVLLWVSERKEPRLGFGLSFETPEEFSPEQYDYIRNYVNTVNAAIYKGDYDAPSPEWEKYIDTDDAVRYYIAKEVTHDVEGFSGSFHMYKDLGEDAKLHFGPVWDFGSSFYDHENTYDPSAPSLILDDPHYSNNQHWIQELVKYERFRRTTRYIWTEFYYSLDWLEPLLDDFYATVEPVIANDRKRWDSRQAHSFDALYNEYRNLLCGKIAYLNGLWDITGVEQATIGERPRIARIDGNTVTLSADAAQVEAFDVAGRRVNVGILSPRSITIEGSAGLYLLRIVTTDGSACSLKAMLR